MYRINNTFYYFSRWVFKEIFEKQVCFLKKQIILWRNSKTFISFRHLKFIFIVLLGFPERVKLLENQGEKRETKYGSFACFHSQPNRELSWSVDRIEYNSDDANAPCLSLTIDLVHRSGGLCFRFSFLRQRVSQRLLPTAIVGHRTGNRANFEKKKTFIALLCATVSRSLIFGFSIFFI